LEEAVAALHHGGNWLLEAAGPGELAPMYCRASFLQAWVAVKIAERYCSPTSGPGDSARGRRGHREETFSSSP